MDSHHQSIDREDRHPWSTFFAPCGWFLALLWVLCGPLLPYKVASLWPVRASDGDEFPTYAWVLPPLLWDALVLYVFLCVLTEPPTFSTRPSLVQRHFYSFEHIHVTTIKNSSWLKSPRLVLAVAMMALGVLFGHILGVRCGLAVATHVAESERVRHPPSAIGHPPIGHPSSITRHPPSVIGHRSSLSAIRHP